MTLYSIQSQSIQVYYGSESSFFTPVSSKQRYFTFVIHFIQQAELKYTWIGDLWWLQLIHWEKSGPNAVLKSSCSVIIINASKFSFWKKFIITEYYFPLRSLPQPRTFRIKLVLAFLLLLKKSFEIHSIVWSGFLHSKYKSVIQLSKMLYWARCFKYCICNFFPRFAYT